MHVSFSQAKSMKLSTSLFFSIAALSTCKAWNFASKGFEELDCTKDLKLCIIVLSSFFPYSHATYFSRNRRRRVHLNEIVAVHVFLPLMLVNLELTLEKVSTMLTNFCLTHANFNLMLTNFSFIIDKIFVKSHTFSQLSLLFDQSHQLILVACWKNAAS